MSRLSMKEEEETSYLVRENKTGKSCEGRTGASLDLADTIFLRLSSGRVFPSPLPARPSSLRFSFGLSARVEATAREEYSSNVTLVYFRLYIDAGERVYPVSLTSEYCAAVARVRWIFRKKNEKEIFSHAENFRKAAGISPRFPRLRNIYLKRVTFLIDAHAKFAHFYVRTVVEQFFFWIRLFVSFIFFVNSVCVCVFSLGHKQIRKTGFKHRYSKLSLVTVFLSFSLSLYFRSYIFTAICSNQSINLLILNRSLLRFTIHFVINMSHVLSTATFK